MKHRPLILRSDASCEYLWSGTVYERSYYEWPYVKIFKKNKNGVFVKQLSGNEWISIHDVTWNYYQFVKEWKKIGKKELQFYYPDIVL
jgi:hypothetical protein